ncbi:MAG TPA: YceI family protein [Cyclobacteriaceae bacterium]|nr:YceI family protein [Cyclobacteriaceae bacterium]
MKIANNILLKLPKHVYAITLFMVACAVLLISGAITTSVQDFTIKSTKAFIHGTSSLHDWESDITKIQCKGSFQSQNNRLKTLDNVEVKIMVEGIKSKEGKIMDHKTYEAFISDKNPFIIYSFASAKVVIDGLKNVTIEALGNLTMAGVTIPTTLIAKGKELPNGDLQLTVIKKLKMSEFNMKPPTAVLGTIKVGDEVTVNFSMVVIRAKVALNATK